MPLIPVLQAHLLLHFYMWLLFDATTHQKRV